MPLQTRPSTKTSSVRWRASATSEEQSWARSHRASTTTSRQATGSCSRRAGGAKRSSRGRRTGRKPPRQQCHLAVASVAQRRRPTPPHRRPHREQWQSRAERLHRPPQARSAPPHTCAAGPRGARSATFPPLISVRVTIALHGCYAVLASAVASPRRTRSPVALLQIRFLINTVTIFFVQHPPIIHLCCGSRR
jgi:hypothetical protein